MSTLRAGGLIAALLSFAVLAFAGQARAATKLAISAPSGVVAGEKFKATVTAKTSSGRTDRDFRGTVTLTSEDGDAGLPGAYKFRKSDRGKHVFRNIRLRSPGGQSLTANSGNAQRTRSISVAELTCAGENYDVNGDVDDGCEKKQPASGRTTKATAQALASTSDCIDPPGSVSGTILSDARTHSPAPSGFDATAGSASAWMKVNVSDEMFCDTYYDVNIQTSGGSHADCYRFEMTWFETDGEGSGTETISDLDGLDTQGFEGPWGDGGDNSATFFFELEKTCPSSVATEAVNFTLTFEF